MASLDEIRESIKAELAELDATRGPLVAALEALDADTNGSTQKAQKANSAPKTPTDTGDAETPEGGAHRPHRVRRGGKLVYTDEAVLDVIRALGPDPVPAGEIRNKLPGLSSNALSMRFTRMLGEGKVKRHGERRTSAYTLA